MEIKIYNNELHIESEMDEGAYMHVRVYNPKNIFIGEIIYGSHKFVHQLYYSESRTTMNALEHSLESGLYRFMIVNCEQRNDKDLHITIKIENSIAEERKKEIYRNLGDEVFQEISWFNSKVSKFDENRIVSDEKRFYKGDFHAHTTYSDGELNAFEANKVIIDQKLDFIAFTEHNCIPFGFKELDTIAIPSFELTLPNGHINIHGLKKNDLIPSYKCSLTDMDNLLSTIVDEHYGHANISINHMFLRPWSFIAKYFDIRKINTIEIINDPTYPSSQEANDKAVAFLDFLWDKGIKIYGVGGSDSHNVIDNYYDGANQPSIYGDPATYVYCEGLSIKNVINGVKNGKSYITRYVEMNICFTNSSILLGQEVNNLGNADFIVEITNFGAKYVDGEYVGKFIINGEVIKEVLLNEIQPEALLKNISSYIKNRDYWYLRFGLYNKRGHVVSYVNPIYSGKRTCKKNTVNELVEEFSSDYDKGNTI
ncbi:MAG: CehA/McbA family metallohydrolase [Alkaliphilus sp.]